MKKLFIRPEQFTADETKQAFQELKVTLDRMREQLAEGVREEPATARLLDSIRNVSENLDFMSHIKQNIFMQIPLQINQRQATGELFVFRDKNRRKSKSTGLSALIALDTAFLGRFETYIVKNGRGISCQFRLSSTKAEELVRENLLGLRDKLEAHDYLLSSCIFKTLEENFTLLDKEPSENPPDTETEVVTKTTTVDKRA